MCVCVSVYWVLPSHFTFSSDSNCHCRVSPRTFFWGLYHFLSRNIPFISFFIVFIFLLIFPPNQHKFNQPQTLILILWPSSSFGFWEKPLQKKRKTSPRGQHNTLNFLQVLFSNLALYIEVSFLFCFVLCSFIFWILRQHKNTTVEFYFVILFSANKQKVEIWVIFYFGPLILSISGHEYWWNLSSSRQPKINFNPSSFSVLSFFISSGQYDYIINSFILAMFILVSIIYYPLGFIYLLLCDFPLMLCTIPL